MRDLFHTNRNRQPTVPASRTSRVLAFAGIAVLTSACIEYGLGSHTGYKTPTDSAEGSEFRDCECQSGTVQNAILDIGQSRRIGNNCQEWRHDDFSGSTVYEGVTDWAASPVMDVSVTVTQGSSTATSFANGAKITATMNSLNSVTGQVDLVLRVDCE